MTASAQRAHGVEERSFVSDAAMCAARAATNKLGGDTVVLDMSGVLGVTDAFVITSGRNNRQVKTIVEEIKKRVKEDTGRSPWSIEGLHELKWVLIDYGDFLVHVFDTETRDYYNLERLWGDAPRRELS